jgi:competence ComEA-like helix-hairpin-helix protein
VTRALRGLIHLAALFGLAAWALALGRFLRDPSTGAGLGVALVLVLVLLAIRRLYRPGGLLRQPSTTLQKGPGPVADVEGTPRQDVGQPSTTLRKGPGPGGRVSLFDGRVDVNVATVEDLVTLPGVGPVAARRIVDEREAGGPFESVEALTRVPGFGPAKVRALADRVRV